MHFTFLSITYNHEDFIIEHLESIKYQIESYGFGMTFNLVISDDSSEDCTISLAEAWIEANAELFQKTVILKSSENKGVCKNYTRGIRNIETKYFKVLAGDDIYGKGDLFEAVKLLREYDVVCTPTLPFADELLYPKEYVFRQFFLLFSFCSMSYHKARKKLVLFPMTPGVIIGKHLLDEQVLSFIDEFDMIEDRAGGIKIYELNESLRIKCYSSPIVLYRRHSHAITETHQSNVVDRYMEDILKLHRYAAERTDNRGVRIIYLYKMFYERVRRKKLGKLLSIFGLIQRLNYLVNRARYRDLIACSIEESYLPNQEHLARIVEGAKAYGPQIANA